MCCCMSAVPVTLSADVVSAGGDITIISGSDIVLQTEGDILTTGAGTVDLEAGGDIQMAAGRIIQTGGGDARLWAQNDLALALVDVGGGGAGMTAEEGSISDDDGDVDDVLADKVRSHRRICPRRFS